MFSNLSVLNVLAAKLKQYIENFRAAPEIFFIDNTHNVCMYKNDKQVLDKSSSDLSNMIQIEMNSMEYWENKIKAKCCLHIIHNDTFMRSKFTHLASMFVEKSESMKMPHKNIEIGEFFIQNDSLIINNEQKKNTLLLSAKIKIKPIYLDDIEEYEEPNDL